VCSFCKEVADESLSVRHRGCGHLSHVDCLPDTNTIGKKCGDCDGSAPSVSIGGEITAAGGEPRTTDGIDYVLYPGTKQAPGLLKRAASIIPGLSLKIAETIENTQNPELLLNNIVKIETIMKRNKMGLWHMLKAGIEMSDFLKNGYTWTDLLKFEDISNKGPERALQTLVALKTSANHFRDYPAAFPLQKVKAHAQFVSALWPDVSRRWAPRMPGRPKVERASVCPAGADN
jgi:hypothetical protein